ncbi:MAG: HxlR-like helix-turn-helix [Thermoplasmata archaeon]|nr:HxlR-like helix-turn-helix [Thermoplasmata archaeon]
MTDSVMDNEIPFGIRMSGAFAPIPEDYEYRLAIRLLDQEPPFDREVIEALVGGRKRNAELQALLHGRNVNVLTKALKRLREEGILQSGLTNDLRERTYALTRLGTLVVFRLHEMVPYHRSEAAVKRGRAAASA